MKHKIITFILYLFLVFNVFGIFSYAMESFGKVEIEEKTVCIVDKYSVGHVSDYGDSESYYMTGKDVDDNFYKIIGHSADVGDVITIYRNPNSANAQGGDEEWFVTEKNMKLYSVLGFVLFVLLTICNIVMIRYCKREKDNVAFKQIGNTCGFYSLGRCLYDLGALNAPSKFIEKMVKECKSEGITQVGEVFDIERLAEIAKKYTSMDVLKKYIEGEPKEIEVSILPVESPNDISGAMKDNARVVFPISEAGVPHYVSLLSLNDEKVTYSNHGTTLEEKSLSEMYKLNQKIGNEYDWKNFESKKHIYLIRRLVYKDLGFSNAEWEKYENDIKENKKKEKELKGNSPSKVNMRGWCLQIKVLDK